MAVSETDDETDDDTESESESESESEPYGIAGPSTTTTPSRRSTGS